MINPLKEGFIYLRNILVWLTPFLLFGSVLFGVIFFLKGDLTKYIKLLEILVWPVTVLIGLFFFRKVVTYMFFSMDEFNFFGVKGDLKNVHQMINEEVEKRFVRDSEEKTAKRQMKELEDKLSNTSNSAEENKRLVNEIYKVYQSYKERSNKRIEELTAEIRNFKESLTPVLNQENITPIIPAQPTADLGTGEVIGNQTGTEPQA